MYNLKIIDNRDGTHVILLKLTKDQILPMIQGFEHLRKSLEKDYKRENYKFYYRRIDCTTPISSNNWTQNSPNKSTGAMLGH